MITSFLLFCEIIEDLKKNHSKSVVLNLILELERK